MRNLAAEQLREDAAFCRSHSRHLAFLFYNQILNNVAVNAYKTRFLEFVFEQSDKVIPKLVVDEQHVVALVFGGFDVAVLSSLVGCVQIDEVAVFVGLVGGDKLLVFIKCELLILDIGEKSEFHCCVAEFFIRQHTVFDKYLDVVPFCFVFVAAILENIFKLGGNFFRNIG